jgi:aminoglycoside 6'-N-acetyltransferase I
VAALSEFRVVPFPAQNERVLEAAARLLVEEFGRNWPAAWPSMEGAAAEVQEALLPSKVAFAAMQGDVLVGWIGGQPQYGGNVWELHPLVVTANTQLRGIGRALVERLEQAVAERGGLTLWVGTDDEANLTSLGGADLYPDVLDKLIEIRNLHRHPFGFYQRLGFEVVGVVPDANGFGKPDILMAKRVPSSG